MTSAMGGGRGSPKSRWKEQNQLICDSDKWGGGNKIWEFCGRHIWKAPHQRVGVPSYFLLPKNHRWPMSPLHSHLNSTSLLSLAKCPSRCDREIFSLLSPSSNNLSSPLSAALGDLSSPLRHIITFSFPIGQSGYIAMLCYEILLQ